MLYHKLVRDRIPEIIKARGGNPKTEIAGSLVFEGVLKEKLREEVAEFIAEIDKLYQNRDSKKITEEAVDIVEVLEEFCRFHNIPWKRVLKEKKRKARTKGRFRKRIILKEA